MKKVRMWVWLFMVVALINLPLHYVAYQKFYVEPLLNQYPPALRPWIDPYPFLETPYWTSTIIIWAGVALIGTAVVAKKAIQGIAVTLLVASIAAYLLGNPYAGLFGAFALSSCFIALLLSLKP